jgi:hypothetical protein
MQTVKLEVTKRTHKRNETEYDKMLKTIKRVVLAHRHETIEREHFLNRGFVIK